MKDMVCQHVENQLYISYTVKWNDKKKTMHKTSFQKSHIQVLSPAPLWYLAATQTYETGIPKISVSWEQGFCSLSV